MLQQKGEQIFEDEGRGETFAGNTSYQVTVKSSDVYEDDLQIKSSFEVFQGKLYYDAKLSNISKTYGTSGTTSLTSRMARLLEEYILVKNEIDILVTQDCQDKSNDSTIWLALQDTAKSHIDDLQNLKSHKLFQSSSSLTAIDFKSLQNEIESINNAKTNTDTFNIDHIIKSCRLSENNNSNSSIRDQIELIKIDSRISALESTIGQSTMIMPISNLILKLDAQINSLNSSDELQSKISAIKTELGTIVNSKSQREMKLIEGASSIKAIHSKLHQLSDVSNDLPIIASRLKMLDSVHRASLGYVSRLHDIESKTDTLTKALSNNEQILKTLKMVRYCLLCLLSKYVF